MSASGSTDPRAPARRPLAVVVLAAGQGKRMKSAHAKVVHPLGGRPLIRHVLGATQILGAEVTVVVVGHQADAVREACSGFGLEFALQEPQLGTGHAVSIARQALPSDFAGDVLVLYGDVPLLRGETLLRLVDAHRNRGSSLSLLTTMADDPFGYGRIVRDAAGKL